MKIGFLSLPLTGHLNPMTALARKVQSSGHEILFFGIPDVEPFARAANLPFVPFCEEDYPAGSITKIFGRWQRSKAMTKKTMSTQCFLIRGIYSWNLFL